MIRSLLVLGLTLLGFLFHSVIGVEAATIALLGATVLMIVGPLDPHESLRDIEWSTLFFFVGLFMLVEAVVHVGIVGTVATALADVVDGRLGVATIGILWVSALGSAIVDNIPYTATAIPIVEEMIATGLDGEPLWWALALERASAATSRSSVPRPTSSWPTSRRATATRSRSGSSSATARSWSSCRSRSRPPTCGCATCDTRRRRTHQPRSAGPACGGRPAVGNVLWFVALFTGACSSTALLAILGIAGLRSVRGRCRKRRPRAS